jgi:hypothetical protein
MIAAVLIRVAGSGGDPKKAVALASMLALMVGIMMLAAGLARLGFIADLLANPTRIGYMNGLALTVLIGQLPKLFGFSVDGDGLIAEPTGFVRGLAAGDAVAAAATVGLAGLLLIMGLRRWLPKAPGVLAAVVASILAVSLFDLDGRGVDVVGMLNANGISLIFAEIKTRVQAKIERYGLTRTIDSAHFFPTAEAAAAAYQAQTGLDSVQAPSSDAPPRMTMTAASAGRCRLTRIRRRARAGDDKGERTPRRQVRCGVSVLHRCRWLHSGPTTSHSACHERSRRRSSRQMAIRRIPARPPATAPPARIAVMIASSMGLRCAG